MQAQPSQGGGGMVVLTACSHRSAQRPRGTWDGNGSREAHKLGCARGRRASAAGQRPPGLLPCSRCDAAVRTASRYSASGACDVTSPCRLAAMHRHCALDSHAAHSTQHDEGSGCARWEQTAPAAHHGSRVQ